MDGHRTALELFPKVAWLGLDTPFRQNILHEEKSEHLGCLAATCAIQLGRLEEAVELLDLARSVFWQQASSLRSDLVMLREEDAELAERFETVSRQLDARNFNAPFFSAGTDNIQSDQRWTEQIGREHRRLVGAWEMLVENIRKLPRFKYFLRSIPFAQLRQAATAGRVVIINVSMYGVDALIFGTLSTIKHVSLSDIDLETLEGLSGNIVLNHPNANASPKQREKYGTRFLKPALRTIWNDVLVHIFEEIQISVESTTMLPQHRI